jgi:polysaccharide export outer membrane protein
MIRHPSGGLGKMKCSHISRLILLASMVILCQSALSTQAAAQSPKETYRIGAGDVLEIVTWKEVDFSRDAVLVRTDGMISFPLLNDVQAAAYVGTPVVTVTVRDAASQKFYILGEVLKTGEYPLNKNLTVLQAFALAGGFTEWASKKEIILLRKVEGQEKIFRVNYRKIVDGNDLGQNVPIQVDDTVIVP